MKACFIIATGHSMTEDVVSSVHNLSQKYNIPIFVVNNAYTLFPEAIACCAQDKRWYKEFYDDAVKTLNKPVFYTSHDVKYNNDIHTTSKDLGLKTSDSSTTLAMHTINELGYEQAFIFGMDLGGKHFFGSYAKESKCNDPSDNRFHRMNKEVYNANRHLPCKFFNLSPFSKVNGVHNITIQDIETYLED